MNSGFIAPTFTRLGSQLNLAIERLLAGPHWKAKTVLAVLALSLFRAFPSYDALSSDFARTTWQHAQSKFDNPMLDSGRTFPPDSHDSKLTYRLTVPLLAHYLRLQQTGLLILFGLVGIALLYGVADVCHMISSSKRVALFICLGVASVWPGEAAFHELRGGYYDALALCMLVVASAASSPWIAGICIFLAAWTDERAIIASSFVLLFALIRRSFANSAAILAACGLHLGTRLYLGAAYSFLPTTNPGGTMGVHVIAGQLNTIPLALWTGFGGSWLIVGCALAALLIQKRYLFFSGFCGALALTMGVALSVVDVTRSMSYCLPALFTALAIVAQTEPPERIERLAAVAGLLSFAVPAYYIEGSAGFWWLYPLPVQLLRWSLGLIG